MSTKPTPTTQPSNEASTAPSEPTRVYDVEVPKTTCLVTPDKLNPSQGGVLAIGEFRGQRIISRQAVDAKSGKQVTRHRLVLNLESLDSSATPVQIEFNGWEVLPALLPFTKGERVVARITGEFNGTFSTDAVAPLK